jgi:lipopolysaccharide transport system ATP-binding protein
MSSEFAIEVSGLGKCYQIYDKPSDRLKQMLSRGRRKYFREFWALHDMSFKIKKGETLGIIGRNGSGKSTLLQMICGTLNPTVGEIKISGKVAALLELGAGFNPEFTGVENVYMAASLYGFDKGQIDQKFVAIAAFADIGDHINQPVKTYSSGMFVRLAFAVIAHVDADILVIDEALAVGDAIFTQKCIRFIKRFKEKGTLFFVSHDTNSVLSLCDKTLWIDSGELLGLGNTKKYVEKYIEFCSRLATEEITAPNLKLMAVQSKDNSNNFSKKENYKLIDPSPQSEVSFYSNIENSESWTTGGAEITAVQIDGSNGILSKKFKGGEDVCVKIVAAIKKNLNSVIIGFILKDQLGRAVLGANTFDKNQIFDVLKHEVIEATFSFKMPFFTDGKYFITAAIANGDLVTHEQQHWIHDSLVINFLSHENSYGIINPEFKSVRIVRKKDAH